MEDNKMQAYKELKRDIIFFYIITLIYSVLTLVFFITGVVLLFTNYSIATKLYIIVLCIISSFLTQYYSYVQAECFEKLRDIIE